MSRNLQSITKILRQLYKTRFIKVFPQKLKDSFIKTPPSIPPLHQCCGSVIICLQHVFGVICRPINIARSGRRGNIFCDWLP